MLHKKDDKRKMNLTESNYDTYSKEGSIEAKQHKAVKMSRPQSAQILTRFKTKTPVGS